MKIKEFLEKYIKSGRFAIMSFLMIFGGLIIVDTLIHRPFEVFGYLVGMIIVIGGFKS